MGEKLGYARDTFIELNCDPGEYFIFYEVDWN